MSGSEGGWVEWGWDAYGPRSRGAVGVKHELTPLTKCVSEV